MMIKKFEYEEDFQRIIKFLNECYKINKNMICWLPERFDDLIHRIDVLYHDERGKISLQDFIYIWEENNNIIGCIFPDGDSFNSSIKPGYEYIFSEMLDLAEEKLIPLFKVKENKKIDFLVISHDSLEYQTKELIKRGYKKDIAEDYDNVQYTIDKEYNIELPEGFKQVYGENILDQRKATACHYGFHLEDDDNNLDKLPREGYLSYISRKNNSIYRKDNFESLIVTDDGDICSFCFCYVNIKNSTAFIEPVCTREKYRKKGFAKQMLYGVINRLKKMKIENCYINSYDWRKNVYNASGFKTIDSIGFWYKEINTDKGEGDEYDLTEYALYFKDINKIEIQREIYSLIKMEELGTLVKSITRITGGLSHRMYKVVTDKGTFAIKELNSGVMKRQDSYSNFIFSEKVTNIVKENDINAIGAIKLKNNDIIKKINNKYFMVFDWVDGKTLKAEEITEKHCEIIGEILAKIHNIDFTKIEDNTRKKINIEKYEWDKYLKLAKKENKNYCNILEQNIELLYDLNKKSNEAIKFANKNLIISHTDLDRKNVIWQNYKPFIIDWEASGYTNPTIELIQVAWYWSGGDIENLDYNKFKIVINSYKKYAKKEIDTDIQKLIYADIYGGLEWLDYNFKRSLCIENNYKQDEIELAESEIKQSIEEIKYNVSQINKMIELLSK